MSKYVLQRGKAGAERLRLLARVTWPSTRDLLTRVGLRRGLRCLDVGCGTGEVTRELARWVGPSGQAVGLEIDEGFLARAEKASAGLRPRPVYRQGNVYDLADETGYDLVYARFLLSHLPEPGLALDQMVRAAAPGGVVVVEDVDFAGHFCYPPCRAFARYVELYLQAVRLMGGAGNLGPRLPGLFLDARLRNVDLHVVLPTFATGEGKRMAQVTLEHIGAALSTVGLATAEEVKALADEIAAHARDRRSVQSLPRIFQVWGQKRPR